MSRVEDSTRIPLAYGVIAASAVLFVRVGIATAVLNPTTAQGCSSVLAVPFLSQHAWLFAVQMALLLQVVLFAVRWARSIWGQAGIFVFAGVLGFADVDALVISMAKNAGGPRSAEVAARAIAVGVLVGAREFRWIMGIGLATVTLVWRYLWPSCVRATVFGYSAN
jgi:uncharacterized membrane protein (DUF4010 family)